MARGQLYSGSLIVVAAAVVAVVLVAVMPLPAAMQGAPQYEAAEEKTISPWDGKSWYEVGAAPLLVVGAAIVGVATVIRLASAAQAWKESHE